MEKQINQFEEKLQIATKHFLINFISHSSVVCIVTIIYLLYVFPLGGITSIAIILYKISNKYKSHRRIKKDIKGRHYGVLPIDVQQTGPTLCIQPKNREATLHLFVLKERASSFSKEKIIHLTNYQGENFQFKERDFVKLIFARHCGFFSIYNVTTKRHLYFKQNFFTLSENN